MASSSSGLTLWLRSDRPGLHPSYLPGDVVQGKLRFTGSKRIKAAAVRAKVAIYVCGRRGFFMCVISHC